MKFKCNKCGLTLEGWDDGNPYIEDLERKRHYYYHPSEHTQPYSIVAGIIGHYPTCEELQTYCEGRSGNASDYVCEACHEVSRLDKDRDTMACGKCGHEKVRDMWLLSQTPCIKCDGTFSRGKVSGIS